MALSLRALVVAAAMSLLKCAECEQLAAAYQRATAVRMAAESDYLVAISGHNPEAIKISRQAVRSAASKWQYASAKLQKHQRTHVMVASAS